MAQKSTMSPYSYYGIGELSFGGSAEERAMGRIGVYADSTRINMQNPATLSRLQYTAFTAGLSLKRNSIESSSTSSNSKASSVDYGALGFPVYKNLGVAFGLTPYSSVGYQLSSTRENNGTSIYNQFEGSGGMNQLFLSSGYQIIDGLSLGASFKFNFGKTTLNNLQSVSNVQLITQEENKTVLRGISSNLGLYYRNDISDKLELSAGFVYTPKSKIKSTNTRVISTAEYYNGSLVTRDSQTVSLGTLAQTDLTLPSQFEMGAGVGQKQKWFVGVEYTAVKTQDFSNPFLSATNVTYENGYTFGLGGFYIPQYNSFSSYWKRVVYRAGLRFEKTGIVLNNESINDFGISFGSSLPVKGFSNATIGFEWGKKGTISQNLVKENYFNVRIGLTLNDKWFQKTKYQ